MSNKLSKEANQKHKTHFLIENNESTKNTKWATLN